jgi:cysteine-rich repeat protein
VARYFGSQCGNGAVEPDEGCEDGNLADGDGCDANCTPTGCGNGIVTSGEGCDDGNVADGDCCDATCAFDAPGVRCADDGNLCATHACDGGGVCTHEVVPAPDCREPFHPKMAPVQLIENTFQWKWRKGASTSAADLGDPTSDTDYAFCVYDGVAGTPTLEFREDLPAGALCGDVPCWRATKTGFAFKDKAATHGFTKVQLTANAVPEKARIVLAGNDPVLNYGVRPMSQQPTAIVQLRNDRGVCWGARYGTFVKNDLLRFKAKSD